MTTARTGPAGQHLQLVPGFPRPLPRPVRPLRDETMSSYISRLAAANHLPYRAVLDLLWQHLPGTAADPLARIRWLAAVTGLDPAAAMMALPELRTGLPSPGRPLPLAGRPVPHLARRAPPCRYCAAAHGAPPPTPGTSTQVFASAENNVCQAHQTWIGPGNSDAAGSPHCAVAPTSPLPRPATTAWSAATGGARHSRRSSTPARSGAPWNGSTATTPNATSASASSAAPAPAPATWTTTTRGTTRPSTPRPSP